MNIRKKMLWRVPVICVVAGYIGFFLSVYALAYFAVETLPDGTVAFNEARALVVHWVLFLVPLLFGSMVLLRSMTRKEIFCSASIMVAYGIALVFIQWVFNLTTGSAAIWMMNLFMPFMWCSAIAQLFVDMFGDINSWLAAVLQVVPVYLFVLFGKREAEASENSN